MITIRFEHSIRRGHTFVSAPLRAMSLLFILATMLVTSCRRPLEHEWEDGNYADILLLTDWSLLEKEPTGLTAIFYPEDGSAPTQIVSNNTRRNVVRLKRNNYKVLVFNQSVYEFGSMEFHGMEAYETAAPTLTHLGSSYTTANDYAWLKTLFSDADSLNMAARMPEDLNAHRQAYEVTPEMVKLQWQYEQGIMFADRVLEFDQTDTLTDYQKTHPEWYVDTIYATPAPVPPTMYITARIRGIKNAYQCRAYITNMARTDLLGPHRNNDDRCIHALTKWTLSKQDSLIGYATTSFRTFGTPGLQITDDTIYIGQPQPMPAFIAQADSTSGPISIIVGNGQILVFEFLLRDGVTRRYFAFDITNNIVYTEEGLRLDLILDIGEDGDAPIILPDVPDVIGSDHTGFDATVEDWQHEDKYISF